MRASPNKNQTAELFSRELSVSSQSKENLINSAQVSKDELLTEYKKLTQAYDKLLTDTILLTQMSDNAQSQLVAATEKIEEQNEQFQYELSLARLIQQKLIPKDSGRENVSLFYKPMQLIGGDFIDFPYVNGNRFSFFISDVSGHGVPAALITAMQKSILMQSRELADDPAALMSHMNHWISGLTANNFITAIYGIVDFDEKKFTFANAGHPLPLLVLDEENIELTGKSFPLAMFPNDFMAEKGKVYENQTYSLEKAKKLLLYTDGITETVPVGSSDSDEPAEYFETARFPDIIQKGKDLSAAEFSESLLNGLEDYRSSQEFDDDIGLIVIDLSKD